MSESRVAILTGGAQGLGAAISKVLLDNGYKVCVSDVQEEKGKQFVKELQEKYGSEYAKFVVCDVTKEDDYKRLFEFAMKEFKRIDVVLNNAGIVSEQNPRKVIEVNLIGPIIGCQMALKYMGKSNGGKGGMVINTASAAGFLPHHTLPSYVASKHGIIGLTRSYGTPYHFEKDGILFMAICPFFVDTEMIRTKGASLVPDFNPLELYADEILTPEYVAEGVLKLIKDGINGATMLICKKGGYMYIGYQEEFKDIPFT